MKTNSARTATGKTLPEANMTTEQVKELQQELNDRGANLAVDVIWGAKSQAAYDKAVTGMPLTPLAKGYNCQSLPFDGMTVQDVMQLQEMLNVTPDGKWGKQSQGGVGKDFTCILRMTVFPFYKLLIIFECSKAILKYFYK